MISFVYFDVGGVLNLDFSGTDKWQQLQSDLGVPENKREQFEAIWQRTRDRICIDCDVDALIPTFEKEVGLHFPKEYSMLNDFIDRFELNPSIWPVATHFKSRCNVGLLTNMYPRMLHEILRRKMLPPIAWDSIVDSSVVGYQKPDEQIFRIAEKKAKTPASEILFVENQENHTSAAKSHGWQTFLYDTRYPEDSSKKLMSHFETHA